MYIYDAQRGTLGYQIEIVLMLQNILVYTYIYIYILVVEDQNERCLVIQRSCFLSSEDGNCFSNSIFKRKEIIAVLYYNIGILYYNIIIVQYFCKQFIYCSKKQQDSSKFGTSVMKLDDVSACKACHSKSKRHQDSKYQFQC